MGPEMAPPTPRRSGRRGGAGTALGSARYAWAPKWPPNPRGARAVAAEPGRPSLARRCPALSNGPEISASASASGWSGARWARRVEAGVVRQQCSVAADAFGDGVDQAPADLEDTRGAREWLAARGSQEGRVEIHGHPGRAAAEARGDG